MQKLRIKTLSFLLVVALSWMHALSNINSIQADVTEGVYGYWMDQYAYDMRYSNGSHKTTVYMNPQVFWNGSNWEELNFENHYASNGYFLIENSHITVYIYEWYSTFYDPNTQRVAVDDERWTVQRWNAQIQDWREVDLYAPSLSYSNNDTHLSVTRNFDSAEAVFNVTYILCKGSLLKHDITFMSKMQDTHQFRVIMKMSGICSDTVRHKDGIEIITTEKHIISPFFFIGDNETNLVLCEYLWTLGEVNQANAEWTSRTLKDIIFNTHSQGCKVDIIMGNYTLAQDESLLIDPDSSTITPPTKDAFAWQPEPDNNYGDYSFLSVRSYENGNARTFIEFSISEIEEGSTISSAELHLYCYSTEIGRTYQFRRITEVWQESTVTWNYQPSITESNGENYSSPSTTGWKWYPLTDMVQDARDEGTVFRVRIKDSVEGQKITYVESRYYSKEFSSASHPEGFPPKLVVVWTEPPSPTFTNVSTNTTIAGQACLFYTKWADDNNLSGYIFGTNNTGQWQNQTWVAWSPPSTSEWSNITKILNKTIGIKVQWCIWANNTYDKWNSTGMQSLITIASEFGCNYIGVNSTLAGQVTKFSSAWINLNLSKGLSHYLFATNNSGSWKNDTWTDSWINEVWAEATNILNSSVGITVAFRFYVNDTFGDEHLSSICFFTCRGEAESAEVVRESIILLLGSLFFSGLYEFNRKEVWSGILGAGLWIVLSILWLIRSTDIWIFSLIFSGIGIFYMLRAILKLLDMRELRSRGIGDDVSV